MRAFLLPFVFVFSIHGMAQAPKKAKQKMPKLVTQEDSLRYYLSVIHKWNLSNQAPKHNAYVATERIGDIYQSRGDYAKAIAYYDSAEIKYKTILSLYSDDYFAGFHARKTKLLNCYLALKDTAGIIATNTNYIFNYIYMTRRPETIVKRFTVVLQSFYGKEAISQQINAALDSMYYHLDINTAPSSPIKEVVVNCYITLFNQRVDFGKISEEIKSNAPVPDYLTKEGFIKHYKEQPVYKLVCE